MPITMSSNYVQHTDYCYYKLCGDSCGNNEDGRLGLHTTDSYIINIPIIASADLVIANHRNI